jgi:hypothetical protein
MTTPSPTQSLIDACQIIPRGKIKSEMQKRKDIGKFPKSTEDFLRCCTILFLQSLLPDPDENENDNENENHDDNNGNDNENYIIQNNQERTPTQSIGQGTMVVTLEHIRETTCKYSFIDLSQISEKNTSAKKRIRKVATSNMKKAKHTKATASSLSSSTATRNEIPSKTTLLRLPRPIIAANMDSDYQPTIQVMEDKDDYD